MSSKQHWLDQPKNVKRIIHSLYVLCLLLFGVEFVHHRHTLHRWEEVFGFYALYGFIGCVVLVLVAKEMRRLVMRKPSYYEDSQGEEDQ